MTKTFCDRCGKEGKVDSIRMPKIGPAASGWVYAAVELCSECCHDIAYYLAQAPPEKKGDGR
jgi:hypothetical protein